MSKRKTARLMKLHDALSDHARLHVKDAAELLNVSEMTVRRDIQENPKEFGFFGGYIMPAGNRFSLTPYDLQSEEEKNAAEKRQACKHCLPHINPGETVFVDCGTTLVHLVDMLPADIELTLVCFALNVLDRAIRKPKLKVVLIGGVYQPATASFAELKADSMFEELAITTAFLSAAGLDPKLGATCVDFHEAHQKRAAIAKSSRQILVVDKSKLGQVHPARFGKLSEFDLVISEDGILDFGTPR